MCIVDQLATSFITLFSTYCCQMMPFGLKMRVVLSNDACDASSGS
jgi:hypothetical protein